MSLRQSLAASYALRAMRPAVLMPIIVFTVLCASGAWLEYSQHSGLMLQAASADVAQLCADLMTARECPKSLRLRARDAKDPWSRAYQCRTTLRGLLIYTMGADAALAGTGRDTDIVCASAFSDDDAEAEAEPCACGVGADATALLK